MSKTVGRSASSAVRSGRPATAPATRSSLGREDWIAGARAALIARGINAVKIGPLARRLRVTRGSFYWHFTDHADLLRELLKAWEHTNTAPFERVVNEDAAHDGARELIAIARLWLDEKDFSPAFDTAVRDWARVSPQAASAVRRVDERRITLLHRIFMNLGFTDPEALVRARTMYFHQVGYYALDIRDEPARRRALAPVFLHVLSDVPLEKLTRLLSGD